MSDKGKDNEALILVLTIEPKYALKYKSDKAKVLVIKNFADEKFNEEDIFKEIKVNTKVHIAVDLESVREADGVTTVKT